MNRAVWLLTIANLLNYLDRYIISSVSPKIQTEFGISNAQVGFLMSAFMVGYVATSPIFGWVGDRGSRPKWMAAGIFVWSLATAMSGWAAGFVVLMISRFLVGIGEASYATIAPAYIRDKVGDEALVNKAMAIFYTAIPIGAALGYTWGGFMAEKQHWSWAFYLGSIPGFLIAILVWRLQEARTLSVAYSQSLKVDLAYLFKNPLYLVVVAGYTAHTFGLGGFAAWMPHYSANTLGVGIAEASFKIGAVTCIAGIVGTLLGGKFGTCFVMADSVSKDEDQDRVAGLLKFSALCSVIAVPFAFWALHAASINAFLLAMLLVQIALFASIAPINTATLAAVTQGVSASAFAVQILVIHALGDVISPPLVGFLADYYEMRYALYILVVAIAVSAVIWQFGMSKRVLNRA